LDWGYKEENQIYTNTNTPVTGTQPPEWQKLAGLYFQIWNGEDHGLIRTAYHLIKKRNGFIIMIRKFWIIKTIEVTI
jgi:hypothetical protein